jgi:RHH-type rel operon transcriptional repressor/antitoxin RelB
MAREDKAGVLFELDPETERRLQEVVARTGKSQGELVREAVLDYLEEAEDRALAAERLSTPERRWTLEELERGLDLER